MNFKSIARRALMLVAAFIFAVSAAFAQSSGDKLYNQGLQLQKTMTVAAQNSAIAKFNSAKKLYDSAAKKAQCDQAISVSRNIIKSLGSGGGKTPRPVRGQTQTEIVKIEPTLTVDNSSFEVDLDPHTLSVNVTTNQDSWDVAAAACEDGSSFLKVNKLGSGKFEIKMDANNATKIREQKVIVSSPSGLTREVLVKQEGRRINLEAKDKIFDFKDKGGKKDTEVSCNSDYAYTENGDRNWYVESKPDWVQFVVNQKKKKSLFGKLGDKIKEKGEQLLGGDTSAEAPDESMVTSSVTIKADPIKPGSIEAVNGRKGQIVVRSGDKTITIYVNQVGKDGFLK